MIETNTDLRDKLREIRLEVTPRIKLTNVFSENERFKEQLTQAYREIDRLRMNLLNPFQERTTQTNHNMPEKPLAEMPREVTVRCGPKSSNLS